MVETSTPADVAELPPPPRNPLTLRQQIHAVKAFHTGQEVLRDAGGHVTRLKFGPAWLTPESVVATSPQAARDILGGTGSAAERTPAHDEVRSLLGASLFTLKHDPWLPRRRALQPVFTKQNVRAFGGHMAQAADMVAASWSDGQQVDLDAECRRLTLRALGRSVLGIDLDERADAIAEPLRTALGYVTARVTSPVRPPRWLPTPARRRARAAAATLRRLAAEVLQACRDDPTRDAPLVRAMIAATDPATGRPLTDDEIRNELIVFMSGRTRHHRHDPDLRAVGARPPPRHAGPRSAPKPTPSVTGSSPPTTFPDCATPSRCCTRRCAYARRPHRFPD